MATPTNDERDALDERFIELAFEQAEQGLAAGQSPFGAVVVDPAGQVVGAGHNTIRGDLDPTAHGEIAAIRGAWARLGRRSMAGYTLYTTCEPCILCSFVITQLEFSRVVFSARSEDVPAYRALMGANLSEAAAWVNAQPDWPPLEVRGDVSRDRGKALLARFPWTEDRPPGVDSGPQR